MRFFLLLSILLAMTLTTWAQERPAAPVELRVATFNILVEWEIKPGTLPWAIRRSACIEAVREPQPDLIGFQEASPKQAIFLKEQFPEFDSVGSIPLTDADIEELKKQVPAAGVLNMRTYTDALIFYRRDLFEKLEEGHWWLSPTTDRISIGFGNTFPRIMVWARLKHLPSGRAFYFVCTHFDNTLPSQIKMATLSHELTDANLEAGVPIIFVGDFNTDHERGDYPKLISDGFRDAYLACSAASKTGIDSNIPTVLNGDVRIDHIFYRGEGIEAAQWRRLESSDPAKKLSDHYPVFAVLTWK